MGIKTPNEIGCKGAPYDYLWFFNPEPFLIEQEFTNHTRTHKEVWGDLIINFWRGRYEQHTQYCSIIPPKAQEGLSEKAPRELQRMLRKAFDPIALYFFTIDTDDPHRCRVRRTEPRMKEEDVLLW